jgi:transcriptional regulator with XRE-family HTH domain
MPRKLPHYLRIERRRAGLSQTDIAVLLGVRTASKISRYERGRRLPPLKTALAYEAILGKPIAELFAGTFAPIEGEVQRRARSLKDSSARPPRGSRFARRKGSIQTIAAR